MCIYNISLCFCPRITDPITLKICYNEPKWYNFGQHMKKQYLITLGWFPSATITCQTGQLRGEWHQPLVPSLWSDQWWGSPDKLSLIQTAFNMLTWGNQTVNVWGYRSWFGCEQVCSLCVHSFFFLVNVLYSLFALERWQLYCSLCVYWLGFV